MGKLVVIPADLVRRIRISDQDALTEVVAMCQAVLVDYAAHLVSDWDAAEDITLQTFVQLWRFAGSLDPDVILFAWLLTVCKNACWDHLRKRRKDRYESVDEIPRGCRPVFMDSARLHERPGHIINQMAVQQLIAQVLPALTPQAKACIMLRADGLKLHEIAARLGIPMGTVKSRMDSARRQANRIAVKLGWDLNTLTWDEAI